MENPRKGFAWFFPVRRIYRQLDWYVCIQAQNQTPQVLHCFGYKHSALVNAVGLASDVEDK